MLLMLMISLAYCSEAKYYVITINAIDNQDNVRYYVESDLDCAGLMKAMGSNDVIRFSQTYAYITASDKFDTIDKWTPMLNGVLVVRAENIIVFQELVSNPTKFGSVRFHDLEKSKKDNQ